MSSLSCRSVVSTRKKLAEISGDTLENIADQMIDLEEELAEADAREERLSDMLSQLATACLEQYRVPANRIKDDEYIYDELGSQLGSAVTDALAMLRGES